MGLPWLLELYRQPWSHEETNKLSVLNQIMQYTRLVRLKTEVHFDPICDSLELARVERANMATRVPPV